MIIPAPNEVAFYVVNFPIYKYGITMALAIFIAIIIANSLFNKKNDVKNVILDYAPMLILCGFIGARLYFCFLNPHFYFSHPIEILNIRGGGLSIHGAIIGGILSLLYIAKRKKINVLDLLDPLSCATILGQAIGRWGNYFNSEAFGVPVLSQRWGLVVPEAKRPFEYLNYSLFHPAFLYESVLDLISFFILLFIFFKTEKNRKGITFFSYLTIYSAIRFVIEGLRTDSVLNIGQFHAAQIVSAIIFFAGLSGLIIVLNRKTKTR